MIDQIIVATYLILTLIIGLLVGRNTNSIKDFAIGKRDFATISLIATVFASIVDGNGTLGLAEAIFSQGPFYCLAFTAGVVISFSSVAFLVAPRFERFFGLLSAGDVLGKLYGPRAKIFMGFAALFESIMLTGLQILAMTHILQYFFSLPSSVAAFGSSLVVLLYTLRGGIRAVTATDVFQFAVLVVAIPIMAVVAIQKIGGFENLLSASFNAHEEAHLKTDYLRHLAVFGSFALPAIFPLTIQRMLMAKNTRQISQTFFMNGLLSLPFYPIVAIIAICALVLLPNIEPNFVFPALINDVMPVGIKGLVIAGLLAVFMSSIDSFLNVGAVAIIHDLFTPMAKNTTEATKLKLARISTIGIALVATMVALYFNNIISMMYFLLCVSNSAFFPGYLFGLLGLKVSSRGFWTGLIAAVCSVLFFAFGLKLFELYTGLISIMINLSILFTFYCKEKYFQKREVINTVIRSHSISGSN